MNKQVLQIIGFCLVVFLGAFQLFQIEPLIGKIVTLRYGGTASVWSICILFFQLVVLAGYFVTFLLAKLKPRAQIAAYSLIGLASLCWSAIPSGDAWNCTNVHEPVAGLLYSLTTHLAVPCIVLATISGMMQIWFNLQKLGNPYPLYSVSNIGSIGALLSYPVLIEPAFTISKTLSIWTWLYCLLIVLLLFAAASTWLSTSKLEPSVTKSGTETPQIPATSFLLWVFLTALGSITLLAYTSYICGDIAPMPLLWVLPLSLYLLTFVLVFSNYPFYKRKTYAVIWILLIIAETTLSHKWQLLGLAANLAIVFITCMICHGELVATKPHPAKLPTFYLATAIGGTIGGVFVSLVAPYIFNFEAERLIVILTMELLLLYILVLKPYLEKKNYTMVSFSAVLVLIASVILAMSSHKPPNLIHAERNFYSSVRVLKEGDLRTFCSGRINHGQQYIDPKRANEPAGAYFMPASLIIGFMREKNNASLNIGDVGLGAGVMAAFGKPGDQLTFFELDPKVETIARKYFTYLSDSKAQIKVNIGDGRAVLASLPLQHYDLLLVDAFNGDAIPCHLITKEAMETYLKHLKQDGLLAFHISNNYLDLQPILGNLAKSLDLQSVTIRYSGGITYVVMSHESDFANQFEHFYNSHKSDFPFTTVTETTSNPKLVLWTDDYTNLASVLKLN